MSRNKPILSHDAESAKQRIDQVFRYLAEMHRVRTPPILRLEDREWALALDELPRSPYVQTDHSFGRPDDPPAEDAPAGGAILRVGRPRESECPEPSVVIKNWLKPGWDQVDADPDTIVKKTLKGQAFAESSERVDAVDTWLERKRGWEVGERKVVQALNVFSDLFELRSRFDRESEKYQLFLADGMLVVAQNGTVIRHPILLQRVELLFNPAVPEFSIAETEDNPELYAPLLRHVGLDGKAIQLVTEELSAHLFHPLGGEATSQFLKDFVHRFWTDGEFIERRGQVEGATGPYLFRQPHLFLGSRNQGLAENIDRYLQALPRFEELPESLLRIVGIESGRDADRHAPVDSERVPVDLLLTKPANAEQAQVIQRVEETGAVLVQGPPGTGKSHTIANLIGHFLAQDKSILVTSHASKALRVVRDQLAKPLQPLCVSVLHSDDESNKQLEESITGIVNYLASTREKKLAKEIQQITERRAVLKAQRDDLWNALVSAVKAEYAHEEVRGERLSPAEAARKLTDGAAHSWLPGPLAEGFELPLTRAEVEDLYALTASLTPEDEALLADELPSLEDLPRPQEFADVFDALARLERSDMALGREFWHHDNQDAEDLPALHEALKDAVTALRTEDEWPLDCLEAGRRGGERQRSWLELAQIIDDCAQAVAEREPLTLEHGPELGDRLSPDEAAPASLAIVRHLEAGKKLGRVTLLMKPAWRALIESSRVEGHAPSTIAHFRAIHQHVEIGLLRAKLVQRWNRQIAPLGAPEAAALGPAPERKAKKYAAEIRRALAWHSSAWTPCEERIKTLGLDWTKLLRIKSKRNDSPSDLQRIVDVVENELGLILEVRQRYLERQRLDERKRSWIARLDAVSRKTAAYTLTAQLRRGIKKGDYDTYAEAWQRLEELRTSLPSVERRRALLERLDRVASVWARAIRERAEPHCQGRIPGDLDAALRYRIWQQRLEQLASVDIDQLQEKLDSVSELLLQASASYVEKKAWLAQLRRTGLDQQQALTGWLGLHKKIGKGKGKHVARLKQEVKNKLVECRSAVPVWIMPLSRVTESFDLATTRFDVVILDEASQSDPLGLFAFALGRSIVVVGDHEQVSPYAVGQSTDRVNALIDEILTDVPNKQLYDGKTSVYDLARQSFGGTIRLLEHFRCVPDIIQFSNQLCYGGEIRPLREASSSHLTPHVVAHRVKQGKESNGINRNEALEIASLVSAVCKLDEYEGCTIGVICMVGTDQALYIDSVLKKRLTISEYQQRRILCGNAAQFQGDERDIIFLSIVSSPSPDGPLYQRQRDDARKVFNVAASRARDQLWVVHSLDPVQDLKAGDLRLRLISHAEDPSLLRPKIDRERKTFRSELEKTVLMRLADAGYLTTQQYRVGDCLIDLVAESLDGKRIAIQCDGDREQSSEGVEEEMARQQTLRRLGWEFIRVRASEFYRRSDVALAKLERRLHEAGIDPVGAVYEPETAAETKQTGESLHERVVKRAELIRNRWKDIPTPSEVRKAAATASRSNKVA